jgi:hypothetical protein
LAAVRKPILHLRLLRTCSTVTRAAPQVLSACDAGDGDSPSGQALLSSCAALLELRCGMGTGAAGLHALRQAVVCLAATALSRRAAARALLHEPAGTATGARGDEGAGGRLLGALLELLPPSAMPASAAPVPLDPALPVASPLRRAPWNDSERPASTATDGRLAPTAASPLRGGSVAGDGAGAAVAAARAALPRAVAEFGPLGGAEPLTGWELVVVVALRNLLAHSAAAKCEALDRGYHRALINACARAAALLAPPPAPLPRAVPRPQPGRTAAAGPSRRATGARLPCAL